MSHHHTQLPSRIQQTHFPKCFTHRSHKYVQSSSLGWIVILPLTLLFSIAASSFALLSSCSLLKIMCRKDTSSLTLSSLSLNFFLSETTAEAEWKKLSYAEKIIFRNIPDLFQHTSCFEPPVLQNSISLLFPLSAQTRRIPLQGTWGCLSSFPPWVDFDNPKSPGKKDVQFNELA